MSNTVIKVENLSKRYRLGLKEKQAETLTGQIGNLIKSPWENLKRLRDMNRFGREDESVFWALKDVNFEVKEGEVLGIIGKNGAGKSTLLKILSQITDPTSGKIEIKGRVASLLEVGTGFHPELSGRENIYMNGTILGMTRREIDSKLDEIIYFSGVEKFIDTPVKFYSSGMKVRLGFSVAAHLEPEILIIDEVLAVGDYEFQRKCLGKMEDVAGNGRTVLFVSHNMTAVQQLCPTTLLLEDGLKANMGGTSEILLTYFSTAKTSNYLNVFESKIIGAGNQSIRLESISIYGENGKNSSVITGNEFFIELTFIDSLKTRSQLPRIDLRIDNQLSKRLIWLSTSLNQNLDFSKQKVIFRIPKCPLVSNEYLLTVHISDGVEVADWHPHVMNFRVEQGNFYENGLIVPRGQTDVNYPFEVLT
ncbi:ABC transporter ATP-binding protein [Algoriphagus chordae]|uniref:ABC-type polysaccharide/polyol phosphate transport system ATPase subunit n=1 Tax=Algoriphagus chordae TaxID=237019 RepID=A0A2W7RAM9_9BACT|nr:ABC transporter ATP-binding protein [Algoriphagus chordae]PZX47645.1 ABC-type polysaccharide/polyol phosphate transport system ATPase subunit [Algoriphagus chordae]